MKEKLVLRCQWRDIFPQNGNDIAWAKVTQSDAAATEVKDQWNKRTNQEMGQAKRVRRKMRARYHVHVLYCAYTGGMKVAKVTNGQQYQLLLNEN